MVQIEVADNLEVVGHRIPSSVCRLDISANSSAVSRLRSILLGIGHRTPSLVRRLNIFPNGPAVSRLRSILVAMA